MDGRGTESSDSVQVCPQDTKQHHLRNRSSPGGQSLRTMARPSQRRLVLWDICELKWPDSAWCICCLAHKWSENAELFFADVNLLRVRAPVHSSVSLPRYYIPVCFSKGSPVTSHLGRDACELWIHCAQGLERAEASGSESLSFSWKICHYVEGPVKNF